MTDDVVNDDDDDDDDDRFAYDCWRMMVL